MDKNTYLDYEHIQLSTTPLEVTQEILEGSLEDIVTAKVQGNYTAILRTHFGFYAGYYEEGSFVFADKTPALNHTVEQLRLFHDTEEWLFTSLSCGQWSVRHIREGAGDQTCAYVDATSPCIGTRVDRDTLPPKFVAIREASRKEEKILPCEELSQRYGLTTRSYITKMETTGQAGYGMYRYLRIAPLVDGKEV